jgi:radical SAM superfamily enzyme YgiQ (UPF0313 family)
LFVISKEKGIITKIKEYSPDAILISCMTGNHKWYVNFLKELLAHISVPVLSGGSHNTFFPYYLEEPIIDYICIGEGEHFILDFANAQDSGGDYRTIANLGYKISGKVIINPVRNLIEDLDSVPFPDRHLYYDRYLALKKYPTKRFLATRGCPYNCSFCFNHSLKSLYKGKGKYIRHRSPENIIEEIIKVSELYPTRTVRFTDDSFTINKKWLLNFLTVYKENINLPFTCLTRANEIDEEEIVVSLKEANCVNVFFGIESGNENLRNKILCKSLKDKCIIKAASLLRKHKISFGTYNMFGLPGETLDNAFETVELNQKIKCMLPASTILQPYPRTAIMDYAIKHGYLEKEPDVSELGSMITGSMFNIDHIRELINLNSFLFFAVRFPSIVPLIKILIKLPPNGLFRLLSFFSMGIVRLKAQNITSLEGLKVAIRFYGKL